MILGFGIGAEAPQHNHEKAGPVISAAAKKLLDASGKDYSTIIGTGSKGSVTVKDARLFLASAK